jgi:hypothetical protein
MEKFETYIYESNPKYDNRMRLIYGIGGILYISLAILINYYINYSSYFAIICGTAFVIYALGYKKLVKRWRCHITFDEQGIKARIFNKLMKFPLFENVNIKWEEIKSIDIKQLKIEIDLKDGSHKEIELGDLMYKQHQELKTKLQEYIQAMEIKIATEN